MAIAVFEVAPALRVMKSFSCMILLDHFWARESHLPPVSSSEVCPWGYLNVTVVRERNGSKGSSLVLKFAVFEFS